MKTKQAIRSKFRQDTMRRDKYRCRCCGKAGRDRQGGDEHLEFHSENNPVELDAHHVTSRDEMPNGGYVKENGISVCDDCHLKAEEFHSTGIAVEGFAPADLYQKIDSSHEKAVAAAEKLK